jgi:hypothetical protein
MYIYNDSDGVTPEAATAVAMNSTVFWYITPYSLVENTDVAEQSSAAVF